LYSFFHPTTWKMVGSLMSTPTLSSKLTSYTCKCEYTLNGGGTQTSPTPHGYGWRCRCLLQSCLRIVYEGSSTARPHALKARRTQTMMSQVTWSSSVRARFMARRARYECLIHSTKCLPHPTQFSQQQNTNKRT
jgi:hypothetical protein